MVRVTLANSMGEENKGWNYAKLLLTHERTGIAGVSGSKKSIEQLHRIAAAERASDGGRLADDADFRRRLAEIEVKLAGLEITNLRIIADAEAGADVGEKASFLKKLGKRVQHKGRASCREKGVSYRVALGVGGH